MADWARYEEADRRGILPPEKKARYDEAKRRGLVPGFSTEQEPQAAEKAEGDPFRGLKLGARDIIEGVGGLADLPYSAVRLPANAINEALGGAPNYFKPIAEFAPDMLGLPKAETDAEKMMSRIGRNAYGTLASFGLGTALQGANAAATAAPTVAQGVGNTLTSAPALQLTGAVTAGAAGDLARQAGAGPWGQMGAEMAGGMAPYGVAGIRNSLGKLVNQGKAAIFSSLGETPPSLGAISDSGIVQRAEGALGSLLPSGGTMKRAGERGHEALARQVKNASTELAGGSAIPQSLEEMGELASRAANTSKDAFTDAAANFENTVYRNLETAPANLSNTIGMIDAAAARFSPQYGALYRQRLSSQLGPILEDGTTNVASIRNLRTRMNEAAKAPPIATTTSFSKGEASQLSKALMQDIEAALPEEGRAALKNYNEWYGREKEIRNAVQKTFFSGDASATGRAILSADKAQLEQLRHVVGDEAFNQLRAGALEHLSKGNSGISASYIARNFGEGKNAVQPQVRDYLFGEKAGQLRDMASALKDSRAYINRSNTANAMSFAQGMGFGGAGMYNPLATLGAAGSIYGTGKAVTSPRVINALTKWGQNQLPAFPLAGMQGARQAGLFDLLDDEQPKKKKK